MSLTRPNHALKRDVRKSASSLAAASATVWRHTRASHKSMRKSQTAPHPDAYAAALNGWRCRYTEALRSAVLENAELHETVKWGHLVYFCNGPVLLIRAETKRILFGFWRGQRLREIEPRLKASGKYEMATLELLESTPLERSVVLRLVQTAVALNVSYGDPTDLRLQGIRSDA